MHNNLSAAPLLPRAHTTLTVLCLPRAQNSRAGMHACRAGRIDYDGPRAQHGFRRQFMPGVRRP